MRNHRHNLENTLADCLTETDIIAGGTVVLGKYEVIGLLGQGGMGQVYLAQDLQLKRLVAVKTISLTNSYNEEHCARFLREAQMASSINHPNVLTVYEIGSQDNRPFLVMEYVEGNTLRDLLKNNQMDLPLAINLAIQLAQGLQAIHQLGIIHRDLKLDNFILRKDGYLKILDFGLAKNTSEVQNNNKFETRVGMVLGTPRYMSPEQARGRELDARSDIFSFGTVLYELLTHHLAFDDEDDMQAVYQVVFHQPEPMSEEIPERLRKLVERIMQKSLKARPESMQEVLDELLAIREELSLVTNKVKVDYLFASTFIVPVNRKSETKQEVVFEKKVEVTISTNEKLLLDLANGNLSQDSLQSWSMDSLIAPVGVRNFSSSNNFSSSKGNVLSMVFQEPFKKLQTHSLVNINNIGQNVYQKKRNVPKFATIRGYS